MGSTADDRVAAAPAVDHRYSAVVAALLDVRLDHPTARFDAELDAAIADGRVDVPTARALRWWQRASVRGAESYATAVVPGVLAACDAADAQAVADVEDLAASWRQAGGAEAAAPKAAPDDVDTHSVETPPADHDEPHPGGQPLELRMRLYPRWNSPARLAAVPDLAATGTQSGGTGRRREPSEETTRAVRAAFRSRAAAPAAPPELIDETSAPTLSRAPFEGKERRGYADPASSA